MIRLVSSLAPRELARCGALLCTNHHINVKLNLSDMFSGFEKVVEETPYPNVAIE
jgi:hypothetical protein